MQTERRRIQNLLQKKATPNKGVAFFCISTKYERFLRLQCGLWQPYTAKYP